MKSGMIAAPLAFLLLACDRAEALPDDVPALKAAAEAALKEAVDARGRRDPKAAALAAERAEKAAAKAKALEEKAAVEVGAAAKEAARQAKLAGEDQEILDRTTGLKAKAYRATRDVALTQSLRGLALAADQMAKGGEPLAGVKESADLGRILAESLAGRAPLADGAADWPGVAADLRGFADQRPPAWSLFLAVACLVTARDGLGLIEIEGLDPATLRDPDHVFTYHLVRGLLLRLNGMPESAHEAFARMPVPTAAAAREVEWQGSFHLILAVLALQNKDYPKADLEVARSLKVWPNNPVAVYLTGELLAETGQRERVPHSLESAWAGGEQEWLAQRIAARARAVRDAKGPAEPLIHDPAFLRDLLLWQLWQAAKTSPKAKALQNLVDAAAPFLDRWIPGGK
jgi:hypothetical protein